MGRAVCEMERNRRDVSNPTILQICPNLRKEISRLSTSRRNVSDFDVVRSMMPVEAGLVGEPYFEKGN